MTNINNKIINSLELISGKQHVLTDYEDRYCYAYDATAIGDSLYLPDVVVLPENTEQICKIIKLASENNIPVIPRSAGTNLVGGCFL